MSPTARFRRPTGFNQTLAAGALLLGTAATVGTALAFEMVGGYIPCALCLTERIPFYVAIPLALIACVAAAGRAPAMLTRSLLALIGGIMLVSVALGVYHSGVEWGFWLGPTSCAQAGSGDITGGGDLLGAIDRIQPPSCDAAAGRFLGLSFAGWNVVASAILAAIALRGALARADRLG